MSKNNKELKDPMLHLVDRMYGLMKRGKDAQGVRYALWRSCSMECRAERIQAIRLLCVRLGIDWDDI